MPAIDYLVVGHLSRDLTQAGAQLGGTAAYAGLTAHVLGRRVGILSSYGDDLDLSALEGMHILRMPSEHTTAFENRSRGGKRKQRLLRRAQPIDRASLPAAWSKSAIVHLGPIVDEIDLDWAGIFPEAFLGITPQGWLRTWDGDGRVSSSGWEAIVPALQQADAVVLSEEDLEWNEQAARQMSVHCRTMVLTLGPKGARVYHRGEPRLIPVEARREVDATGAGDIFAAAYFIHFQASRDPWASAEEANQIAARSVDERGLLGITAQRGAE